MTTRSDETLSDEASERAKRLGALLKRARIGAGKSRRDCAAFLGATTGAIARYEDGKAEPSLGEVEALAFLLRVPVHALLGDGAGAAEAGPEAANVRGLVKLRRHIIGARLKQARARSGAELKPTADAVGISPAMLRAYESGKRSVPIGVLERLLAHFGLTTESMLDVGVGQFGERQLAERQQAAFAALPPELRAFVAGDSAEPYLRVALSLSRLPADELRAIGRAMNALTGG